MASRGISGLYAGFLVKSVYLGGSGALLATLIPIFKKVYGVAWFYLIYITLFILITFNYKII